MCQICFLHCFGKMAMESPRVNRFAIFTTKNEVEVGISRTQKEFLLRLTDFVPL